MKLTAQEEKILDRLIEGRAGKQVASELGITDNTLRGYIRHICAKMDAPNRLVACAKWSEMKKK